MKNDGHGGRAIRSMLPGSIRLSFEVFGKEQYTILTKHATSNKMCNWVTHFFLGSKKKRKERGLPRRHMTSFDRTNNNVTAVGSNILIWRVERKPWAGHMFAGMTSHYYTYSQSSAAGLMARRVTRHRIVFFSFFSIGYIILMVMSRCFAERTVWFGAAP